MGSRIAHFLSILVAGAAVTGCGTTAPARFYSLDSTAIADGAPATSVTVMVGPVVIPVAVDQPEFVVNTAPNRVEVDEFNRWVSPLNDAIARAVAATSSCYSARRTWPLHNWLTLIPNTR